MSLQNFITLLTRHIFCYTGNFAPVSEEHVAVPVEVVEGAIPDNFAGAFLRNGPNPLRDVQKKRYHWFDGRELLYYFFFLSHSI